MPSPRWPIDSMVTISAIPARPKQKFLVAVAAGDRRGEEAGDTPAMSARQPGGDAFGRLLRGGQVADDAALADKRAADLELRLDQENAPGVRLGQGEGRRQSEFQRDEAEVGDNGADAAAAEMRCGEVARVQAFVQGEAWVGRERRVELAVAHLDRDDMRGPALQ